MAEVKKEFFPEMATPSNSRNRTLETAERLIFCPEEGCTMNGTLRKVFQAFQIQLRRYYPLENVN